MSPSEGTMPKWPLLQLPGTGLVCQGLTQSWGRNLQAQLIDRAVPVSSAHPATKVTSWVSPVTFTDRKS